MARRTSDQASKSASHGDSLSDAPELAGEELAPSQPSRPDRPSLVSELGAKDLDVVFQPIVDLRDGSVFALEALVRCKRPEFRDPMVLIEHAVAEGCSGNLGRHIREVAFARCQQVPLFVNLDPHELSEQWLVRPDDPLCFHDRQVYLEITESAPFAYFELCRSVLRELRSRNGVHLVVDDLGAGHSNLKRIADLEPSIVKLDLMLTRDIHKHPRQQILVRQIVTLCAELQAEVVAEGIEQIDELKAVIDTGARYGQGYLLARPQYPVPPVNWPLPSLRPAEPARQVSLFARGTGSSPRSPA